MKCPHCGLAIPAKSKQSVEERKQAEDRDKAQRAITLLRDWQGFPTDSERVKREARIAAISEITRLQAALDSHDPFQLKRIFRRKET